MITNKDILYNNVILDLELLRLAVAIQAKEGQIHKAKDVLGRVYYWQEGVGRIANPTPEQIAEAEKEAKTIEDAGGSISDTEIGKIVDLSTREVTKATQGLIKNLGISKENFSKGVDEVIKLPLFENAFKNIEKNEVVKAIKENWNDLGKAAKVILEKTKQTIKEHPFETSLAVVGGVCFVGAAAALYAAVLSGTAAAVLAANYTFAAENFLTQMTTLYSAAELSAMGLESMGIEQAMAVISRLIANGTINAFAYSLLSAVYGLAGGVATLPIIETFQEEFGEDPKAKKAIADFKSDLQKVIDQAAKEAAKMTPQFLKKSKDTEIQAEKKPGQGQPAKQVTFTNKKGIEVTRWVDIYGYPTPSPEEAGGIGSKKELSDKAKTKLKEKFEKAFSEESIEKGYKDTLEFFQKEVQPEIATEAEAIANELQSLVHFMQFNEIKIRNYEQQADQDAQPTVEDVASREEIERRYKQEKQEKDREYKKEQQEIEKEYRKEKQEIDKAYKKYKREKEEAERKYKKEKKHERRYDKEKEKEQRFQDAKREAERQAMIKADFEKSAEGSDLAQRLLDENPEIAKANLGDRIKFGLQIGTLKALESVAEWHRGEDIVDFAHARSERDLLVLKTMGMLAAATNPAGWAILGVGALLEIGTKPDIEIGYDEKTNTFIEEDKSPLIKKMLRGIWHGSGDLARVITDSVVFNLGPDYDKDKYLSSGMTEAEKAEARKRRQDEINKELEQRKKIEEEVNNEHEEERKKNEEQRKQKEEELRQKQEELTKQREEQLQKKLQEKQRILEEKRQAQEAIDKKKEEEIKKNEEIAKKNAEIERKQQRENAIATLKKQNEELKKEQQRLQKLLANVQPSFIALQQIAIAMNNEQRLNEITQAFASLDWNKLLDLDTWKEYAQLKSGQDKQAIADYSKKLIKMVAEVVKELDDDKDAD